MPVLGFVSDIEFHFPKHLDAREEEGIDTPRKAPDVLEDAVDAVAKSNLIFFFRFEMNVACTEFDGADHDGFEYLRCGNFENAVFEGEKIAKFLLEFFEVIIREIDFEMIEIVEEERLFVDIPGVFK